MRPDALPASIAAPCPHPSDLLSRGGTVADDEISLGRLGSALIDCEGRRAAAVGAFNGVRGALIGKEKV